MKKKIIALILCICLISCTCIQPAYAMGAEGAIIGGGAAAAGVTLTMPQVALIVAAGFGLVYAVNHAEDIANGLNNALENAAQNISNGIEELTYWKEQATKGIIALSGAPAWIKSVIGEWALQRYADMEAPDLWCDEYSANTPVPSVNFWQGGTKTYPVDVTVVRAGVCKTGTTNHTISVSMLVIATESLGNSNEVKYTHNGVTYYTLQSSTGLNPSASSPLAGSNLKAWEAVSALPSREFIENNYSGSNTQRKMFNAWLDGYFGTPVGSICPDEVVGGIDDAIGNHGIDSINVPDLDIGGSKLLTPENVADGSIDDVLGDVLTRLKQQEITWEQYMQDVAVGTPSVSIPQSDGTTLEYPITDAGVSDVPLDTTIPDNPVIPGNPSVEVPEGLEPFTISLKDFFPFCIPFDIADFINVLCAEPEAPCFEWEFPSVDGTTEQLTIDLSPFDSAAQLLRNMELLLFCIGLALMTRNLIRG